MITYVPVIMYLEENYSIKKVLETGSGFYSTSLFLDKRYFKNLQKLVSYENELKWFSKVKKNFNKNNWKYFFVNGEISKGIKKKLIINMI